MNYVTRSICDILSSIMKDPIYITTTLPYVNADPHIGFALEIVQADAFARTKALAGQEVFFNFGTDEHGLKIFRKATEQGKDPQQYVDEYAAKFDNLKKALNLSYNNFIRTTDDHHIKAAQEFWKKCLANEDIYKKLYEVKYCVGCELEKTDSELVDGKCPIHPNLEIELIEEENYFFKFSKFQQPLLDLYKNNPEFVIPDFRLKEITNFVEAGLQDFSISRLKEKMPWGIPVPGDEDHVMYVWFDALINYISAVGWPEDMEKFEKWWPVIQFAGKDNLRQQSAMWQAMLMSAGIPNSHQVFIHGFINVNGQKISKSLGNAVNPYDLVEKYGTDVVRYFLLAKIHPVEDSDFTYDRLEDAYQADLANGLGNLVSRIAAMAEKECIKVNEADLQISREVSDAVDQYKYNLALENIWDKISETDKLINDKKVWELEGDEKEDILSDLVNRIRQIAFDLQPFMPETAERILKQYSGEIEKEEALFPRLQ